MAYTVLARKYRPQTFEDLVGQEHVSKTLANAIAQDRVAHAFLFTGVRGVGKTTSARILAKALNCEKGPTVTPCNACAACTEITAGVDVDVLEMDGASNNSVDDVRRLQESIPYRPSRDRFKVVIVDEVHMLSTGAFNAFLKTLEEPPAHVKFIFATTESHKVPVTIRSRCQRYDFRLIPERIIAERVRSILRAESIDADDAAVDIVAREASGSMRDALTLLDQVVAFGGERLVGHEVAAALGIADRRHLLDVYRALVHGHPPSALETIDAVATQGLDLLHFVRQLVGLARDAVVLRVLGAASPLVTLGDAERDDLLASLSEIDTLELERAFHAAAKLVDEVARSTTPRVALEIDVVRIASRPRLVDIATLIARLEAAEGGTPSPPPSPRGAPPSTAPAPPRSPAAASLSPRAMASIAPGPPPTVAREPAAPPAQPRPTASSPPPATNANSSDAWLQILAQLRDTRPALGAVLQHGIAKTITASKIELIFPEGSFFGRQAEAPDAKQELAATAEAVLGTRPTIVVSFAAEIASLGPTVAEVEARTTEADREATRQRALSHPRVVEALQVFPESAGNIEVRVDD